MWHLGFTIALLFFAILSIPIITLLHELGHAIPALLFTQDTVTMYVGSYGNPENNREIKLGRLIMLFNRNTVIWRQGICKHSSTGIIRQIIIIAGGPVCTVLIAFIFTFIIFNYNLHEYFKLFILVFTAASFFSFLHNIIPDNKHFLAHDGNNAYNDGSLLKSLLKYKGISPTFRQGIELFNAKKYKEAVKMFSKIASNDREVADAYRFIILSFIYLNKLTKALQYHELLRTTGELNAEDCSNGGLIKSRLALHQEAIDEYSQCLSINPTHIHCLNNRGYNRPRN
ncbi:MAG: tetratricopeptide repeat protein [Bacteroidota bacterium]